VEHLEQKGLVEQVEHPDQVEQAQLVIGLYLVN
jgi:hypothetical protein